MKILSTKKLKPNQRDLLLGQGFTLVDYNAIKIEILDFEMPQKIENAIFTSQHGVSSILNYEFRIQNCFCVGQKTKSLLEKNSLKVIETANYGKELGKIISEKYKNETFHFFCGNERRDEIPEILKESKIDYTEIQTYKTKLNFKKFEQKWDAILFFSPSGVESFVKGNGQKKWEDLQGMSDKGAMPVGLSAMAICIGNTTAQSAKDYFKNIIISNSTSVESVIAKTVKTLIKNKE